MSNYKRPKSRKEKIEAIKLLMSGQISIADLKEPKYHVTFWREDPTDPNYMESFIPGRESDDPSCFVKESKEEHYKRRETDRHTRFVTLDLNK